MRDTWNKLLEGIPNLDFTPEEWRKIEFLKYLRNKGDLTDDFTEV